MAEETINTFSDSDSERIIRAVRRVEQLPAVPEGRVPTLNEYPIYHFKNGATAIAAFNETTKVMSKRSCRIWNCDSTGALVDSGIDIDVYNPGGEFVANKWGVAMFNEAGLLVALVEKCG